MLEFQRGESDVDVCVTESLFVHVTRVPTPIVRSAGTKARGPSVDAPAGMDTEAV